MEKKHVRVCPKCGSTNVSHHMAVEAFAKGSVFNHYRCNECKYDGTFFPEVTEDEIEGGRLKKGRLRKGTQ